MNRLPDSVCSDLIGGGEAWAARGPIQGSTRAFLRDPRGEIRLCRERVRTKLSAMGKEGQMGRSSCATVSALELVGDRWSLLLIRSYVFAGNREYSDFLEMPENISTNILASRLAWLTELDMFIKNKHPTNKKKFYYEITEKGFDLVLVVMELARWAWTYLPETWAPPAIKEAFLRDRDTFMLDWRAKVRSERRGI